jgi:hypothetical protein
MFQDQIKTFQDSQKAKIFNSYEKDSASRKDVDIISKADFEEKFPADKFELYSLLAIHKFRTDLMKSENYTDAAFSEAAEGLVPYRVQQEGKQILMFVRAKSVAE